MENKGGEFPTTNWSLVAEAAVRRPESSDDPLAQLVTLYIPPIRFYLQQVRGFNDDAAEEIIQAFIAEKIVEKNLPAAADQTRGKFRSLLVRSLDNFIIDLARRERKRPEYGAEDVYDNDDVQDGRDADPLAYGAEADFELAWAKAVLAEAISRCAKTCQNSRQAAMWQIFEYRVLNPLMGTPPLGYEEIRSRLGFSNPSQATNSLATAKRLLLRTLGQILQEYHGKSPDLRTELFELKKILLRAQDLGIAP